MSLPAQHGYRAAATSDSPFSVAIRVWPCDRCGTPKPVPREAAEWICDDCGETVRVAAPAPLAVPDARCDEPARLERLRAQLPGRWFVHDEVIRYLSLLDGEIDDVKRAWGEARQALAEDRTDDERAERLLSLSYIIDRNTPPLPHNQLALRALYEASAEMFEAPVRRQRMLASLSLLAARAGDVESAKAWLAHMTARSDDLHADTLYRCCVATIATREGDAAAVHDAFAGDVPLHESGHAIALTLRANAFEQQGDPRAAAATLRPYIRREPSALSSLTRTARSRSSWHPCRATMATLGPRELRRRWRMDNNRPLALMLIAVGLAVGALNAQLQGSPLQRLIQAAVMLAGAAWWLWREWRLRRLSAAAEVVVGRVTGVSARASGGSRVTATIQGPDGSPPGVVTFDSALAPSLIEGLPFVGFYNPSFPGELVDHVFSLTRQQTKRIRG